MHAMRPRSFLWNEQVDASYSALGVAARGPAQFLHCRTPAAPITLTFSLRTAVLDAYATSNPGWAGTHAFRSELVHTTHACSACKVQLQPCMGTVMHMLSGVCSKAESCH